jgi:hypothetical protein
MYEAAEGCTTIIHEEFSALKSVGVEKNNEVIYRHGGLISSLMMRRPDRCPCNLFFASPHCTPEFRSSFARC